MIELRVFVRDPVEHFRWLVETPTPPTILNEVVEARPRLRVVQMEDGGDDRDRK